MKKVIRIKLIREQIINKLDKYGRRMQQLAENAYKLRQLLETLDKQENENAVHQDDTEGSTGSGSVDNGTGGAELLDNKTPEAVLAEQPTELPSN